MRTSCGNECESCLARTSDTFHLGSVPECYCCEETHIRVCGFVYSVIIFLERGLEHCWI